MFQALLSGLRIQQWTEQSHRPQGDCILLGENGQCPSKKLNTSGINNYNEGDKTEIERSGGEGTVLEKAVRKPPWEICDHQNETEDGLCCGEIVGGLFLGREEYKVPSGEGEQAKGWWAHSSGVRGWRIIQDPGPGSTRPSEAVWVLTEAQLSLFHGGGLVNKGGQKTYTSFHLRVLRTGLATSSDLRL